VIFSIIVFTLGAVVSPPPGQSIFGWIGLLFLAFSFFVIPFPLLSVTVRRLHDINMSGWWSLLSFFPLIPIFLLFRPGTKGQNRFGPQQYEMTLPLVN
jgi:uncharacterized membrane protein YhaH (DUF805 family)